MAHLNFQVILEIILDPPDLLGLLFSVALIFPFPCFVSKACDLLLLKQKQHGLRSGITSRLHTVDGSFESPAPIEIIVHMYMYLHIYIYVWLELVRYMKTCT